MLSWFPGQEIYKMSPNHLAGHENKVVLKKKSDVAMSSGHETQLEDFTIAKPGAI